MCADLMSLANGKAFARMIPPLPLDAPPSCHQGRFSVKLTSMSLS